MDLSQSNIDWSPVWTTDRFGHMPRDNKHGDGETLGNILQHKIFQERFLRLAVHVVDLCFLKSHLLPIELCRKYITKHEFAQNRIM